MAEHNTKFYRPFSTLATEDVKCDKEFKSTLKNGRDVYITRGDWESAPVPLATILLSDETMEKIVSTLVTTLDSYDFAPDCEEDYQDAFWKEYETIAHQFAIYHEDFPTEGIKAGDKVFDLERMAYADVIVVHSNTLTLQQDGMLIYPQDITYVVKEY